jgi:hypothetical protein
MLGIQNFEKTNINQSSYIFKMELKMMDILSEESKGVPSITISGRGDYLI